MSFRRLAGAVLTGAAVALAPLALYAQKLPDRSSIPNPFPKLPEGRAAMFEVRDSRALDMLQYMHCMNSTVAAGESGLLGKLPEGALIVCVKERNEWRGLVGMLDDERTKFTVSSQFALRGPGMRVTEAIDTTKAAAVARGMIRGISVPAPGGSRYSFTPVPLLFQSFVEVWFMPVQSNASRFIVGGDSVIQMTADGRREQGHSSKAPSIRELPMPSGSRFVIESTEQEIPLISELLAARLALLRVPEVQVRTKKVDYLLSNATRKWAQTPRGT